MFMSIAETMPLAAIMPRRNKRKPSMHVGSRIKQARKLRGISQEQLAKAVGTAQPVISALESGKQRGTAMIVEIAHVLRVRPMWLADGSGPMDAKPGENARDEALQRLLDAWELLTPEQRELFAKMVQSVAD
jgi:transcriptional regulator with XRE-family HTH domain